jgi:hypothetical protein
VIFGPYGGIRTNENAITFLQFGNSGIALCAGVAEIGPVSIGNNVVIASSAYVNRDAPDNALVIGNPGKIVKIREEADFDNIRLLIMFCARKGEMA